MEHYQPGAGAAHLEAEGLNRPARVLLVDDSALVRAGLRIVLAALQMDVELVGEAVDGLEAIEMAEQLRPDVILMDITLPNLDGMEATRRLKERLPHVKVVMLTAHQDREYFVQSLEAGATGYVVKRSAGVDLTPAINAALQDELYFSAVVADS